MKKRLTVIMMCLLAYPLTSTSVLAATHCKKHCKKCAHKQLDAAKTPFKDASPAETAQEANADFWSGMSGSFTLTSNYVFRGVSQSSNLPATQGGLTYTVPAGIYVNVWGSNVKFAGTSGGTIELDTIAGWRGEWWKTISYDINIDRYNYPGSTNLAYNEANALLGYRFFQLGLGYSSNVYSTHQTGIYTNGTISYDIPAHYFFDFQDVSVAAEFGHYSLPRAAGNSYNDYSLTLNKKLTNTYSILAQWTGTNGRQHNPPYDSNQLLAAVNASF